MLGQLYTHFLRAKAALSAVSTLPRPANPVQVKDEPGNTHPDEPYNPEKRPKVWDKLEEFREKF